MERERLGKVPFEMCGDSSHLAAGSQIEELVSDGDGAVRRTAKED